MAVLPDFYDADKLEQVAINLFYGWGYNFYRIENQLRADDQMIRAHVTALLGAARECVAAAESMWRREHFATPTREKPLPDPAAVAGARTLERLAATIGALAGRIGAQPTPENDRMTQRYRNEAETLARLIDCDKPLVARADMLRQQLDGVPGTWMIENAAGIEAAVAAMGTTLRERQAILG